jgi:hypothetical protein
LDVIRQKEGYERDIGMQLLQNKVFLFNRDARNPVLWSDFDVQNVHQPNYIHMPFPPLVPPQA